MITLLGILGGLDVGIGLGLVLTGDWASGIPLSIVGAWAIWLAFREASKK